MKTNNDGSPDLLDMPTGKLLKLKLLAARITKLEAERKRLSADFLSRDEVRAENDKRSAILTSALMDTKPLLAMLKPYLDPAELASAHEEIEKWARGLCDRFSGQATTETT